MKIKHNASRLLARLVVAAVAASPLITSNAHADRPVIPGPGSIEDISGRTYGGMSGNIASGTWASGGTYSATIGDDVYIYTNLDIGPGVPANGHGIFCNASGGSTGGNNIKIDVEGLDGDGIRSDPGGYSNGQNARAKFVLGDNLTIWVRGESSDCVNLNGFSTLDVGDNARFFAWGTHKSSGNGSYALRANMGSRITVGKNSYTESAGDYSHALYTVAGLFQGNTYDSSIIMGDGAQVVTYGTGSHAANNSNNKGTISFLGSVDIKTEGSGAYGIQTSGSSATTSVAGATHIVTEGANSHGIYTSGSSSVTTLGNSTRIDNKGAGSHSIYAYSGKVTGSGKFTLGAETGSGSLYSRTGTIDLVMNNQSSFMGYTDLYSLTNAGAIKLDIKQNSVWGLSQSSNLTSLKLDGTSKIIYTLGGTAESEYTHIYATSDITLAFGSTMEVVFDGGFKALEGDEFTLVSVADMDNYYAGYYGHVKFDFTRAELDEGLFWDTTSFHEDGKIRVVSFRPIPEPAAFTFGLAGLGLMMVRRRATTRRDG